MSRIYSCVNRLSTLYRLTLHGIPPIFGPAIDREGYLSARGVPYGFGLPRLTFVPIPAPIFVHSQKLGPYWRNFPSRFWRNHDATCGRKSRVPGFFANTSRMTAPV